MGGISKILKRDECNNIKTIDDMFRWKLDIIYHDSVEKINNEFIEKLGWIEETDVLYSFLLTYRLGLEVINEDKFHEKKEEYKEKNNLKRINPNSPMFLYSCSLDSTYAKLNNCDEYNEFLSLYFSIGNIIPIWPGGNEAKGKKGIYDIPEIFFRTYDTWTKALVEKYPNANMGAIINNSFLVCRNNENKSYSIKGYRNAFSNLDQLRKMMKDNNQMYFDYLKHRNDIIKARNESIIKIIHTDE